jgi:hypothetical protein
MAAGLALLLGPTVSLAQEPTAQAAPHANISSYPASFFTGAHPANANDMVARLPGFSLDTGENARGFAGTAGNVLVDGARPTAKTDDLQTILTRIPAGDVERIDLIRGAVPGIDLHGWSVVANIIRRRNAADQIVAIVSDTYVENGEWAPGARLEYHGASGATRYEAALERTVSNWDDSPGYGYRRLGAPGAEPQLDELRSRGILQLGYSAHGGITVPLWGGEWENALTLQSQNASNGISYSGGGGSRFDAIARIQKGEYGSHWQGNMGAVALESLVLQRLGNETDINTSAEPSGSAIFTSHNNSGESIARLTARYAILSNLNLEAGGEGAYNFLNGRSTYVANGTATRLPNANSFVHEKRGEAFTTLSWAPAPSLSVEAGMRAEFSGITATGDTRNSRDFFYPKPRLLIAWSPDAVTQLRLRAERKLGQLNFSNFVASSNLSTYGVAAGNTGLRPDKRWQFQADLERHFWGQGALVLSLLHEDITDLQDYVPVGGGLDAPGNVPHALSDKISLSGTIPLDFMGISHGLLKPNLYWQFSSLADPVTGLHRPISDQRNRRLQFSFTQDLADWHSSWGFDVLLADETWGQYRISQINYISIHTPYTSLHWVWNPAPNLSLRIEGTNVIPYRFELEQNYFSGPRDSGSLALIQHGVSRTRPQLFIELRKSF